MTDSSTPKVSFRKAGVASSGETPRAKGSRPPRLAVYAAGSLVVSALAALVGALDLFGVKNWLFRQAVKANNKLKVDKRETVAKLHSRVDQTVQSQLIATIVLMLALGFVALAIYRGRHWARWGTVGLWVLASFTGTMAGLNSILIVGVDVPMSYKLPAFIAGLGFLVAVVLVNLRPNVEYFNLSRPARPTGAPARRGMFAPRAAGPAGTATGVAANANGRRPAAIRKVTDDGDAAAAPETARARGKQRANADAVAKGAELARTRAKASKSRRTGA